VAPDDARGRPLAPDQTPQARAARGETFSLSFSLPTGAPSLVGEDTRRWFVATGQPLHEEGATHAIVVIRDVTLSNRHRRLQEEFLALAGHELRTPLTAVKGYLDLLTPLLRAGSDERSRLYATRALHQTQALVTLVRDLTDAARLQGGQLTLDRAALDLVPLIAQVAETVQALPAGHAIRLDLAVAPVWVHGDGGRLEQVLFNLLTNAGAHAPSATPIDMRLRRARGGRAGGTGLWPRDRGRSPAPSLHALLSGRARRSPRAGLRAGPLHLPGTDRGARGPHHGRVHGGGGDDVHGGVAPAGGRAPHARRAHRGHHDAGR